MLIMSTCSPRSQIRQLSSLGYLINISIGEPVGDVYISSICSFVWFPRIPWLGSISWVKMYSLEDQRSVERSYDICK